MIGECKITQLCCFPVRIRIREKPSAVLASRVFLTWHINKPMTENATLVRSSAEAQIKD